MRKDKIRLIAKQGSNVTVRRFIGPLSPAEEEMTKAIVGRLSSSTTDTKNLENVRRGVFYPDFQIDSGDFVHNDTLSETYVVSGTFPEPYRDQIISHVATLMKCNHLLSIKSSVQVADSRGNLKMELKETYSHVPCYVEQVTNELRQFDPGILPDTDYRIYTTDLDVKETDQLLINVRNEGQQFKITARDYVTYPKMLVLQVTRDIRKG
ncbi:hypothetical protein IAQ67_28345 (plasmid) [Paenibacillus peoriae]|uniref:Uncharacterized protein n=1 Tax=Paenibacillus peoriae TaxID=59893 RepID=A0A7H0YH71_9BACL|nr:hypothetical protein [Paenibacillus peoriae]QNR70429.1 hypothetical protein IAQ67_28345 [Paenibacillus peoriae]